jgi:tetratricopeptide (TPR) repeat protein
MYAVNNTGDKSLDEKLRWVIPYYLGADLAQSKYLSVLPQDRLMQLLQDMKQLDEARPLSNTLDKVSEAANVGYFVLPSFTKIGDNFWISLTVRKARSDETVGEPDTVKGRRPEDVISMIDELSAKAKSKLSLSPAEIARDPGENVAKITTGSFEAVRYYVEAQEDYAQGNFKASLQDLENAIKEDPAFGLAYLKMADDYEYLGRIVEQREYLLKALSLVDRVSEKDRYHIQGYAASILKESPLPAIEIYHKMVDRFPRDEEGTMMLGAIYRNLEEWDQALDYFEKLLAINPRSASLVHQNKIFIFTLMGRYKEALELNEAGIRDNPRDQFLMSELPLLYLIQGQYDRADAELGKALALEPDDPGLIELKGASCLLRGDVASAMDVYERLQRAGESMTDTPDLKGRCGLIYLRLGRGKFRQAQAEIPGGIILTQRAGRVLDELDLRLTLAYCQLRVNQYPRVAETVRSILDLAQRLNMKESQARALHLSGLASLGMGRVEEAKDIGQRLRLFVERTGFPKGLRRYEHLMGHIALAELSPDAAIRHFEQAIAWLPMQGTISDEQAFYYDGLAAAYYQSGDWEKAIDSYQSIQGLTTGRVQWGDIYARSFYWLGKCYQRSGRSTEATASYQKFLDLWKNADEGLPEVADARKELEGLRKGH